MCDRYSAFLLDDLKHKVLLLHEHRKYSYVVPSVQPFPIGLLGILHFAKEAIIEIMCLLISDSNDT